MTQANANVEIRLLETHEVETVRGGHSAFFSYHDLGISIPNQANWDQGHVQGGGSFYDLLSHQMGDPQVSGPLPLAMPAGPLGRRIP